MPTDRGHDRGDYPRVCDCCGVRYMFRELVYVGEMRWFCPDDAEGLTATQISRFNARAKPLIVRPRKNAKDYSQTPIYGLAEAQIFNFLASTAPAGETDGSRDPLSAAWAAIYMADVMNQDKRPQNWERVARTTVIRCCDYLITKQCGGGLLPTTAISDPRYGGITADTDPFVGTEFSVTTWSTEKTIAAGIAFLKAYQALGTVDYLQAADRCATFIRHVQSGNVQATAYTVYPSGGGAYYVGGLASAVGDLSGLLTNEYHVADVAALWFLSLLSAVHGSTAIYGDAAATAFFGANAAPIATMMSDLTTFAEVGPRDSANGSAFTPGLSTTAPRTVYTAATNGGFGQATWTASDTVATRDLALAIAGLYFANGTDAKITEMMAWLKTFSSNDDNRTPDTLNEALVVEGITGTYDPTLCPADTLVSSAPFTEADGALYDWASFGLLSPILAADQSAMRRSKDILSTSVRYSFYDIENKWLGPIGSSGLSLQPIFRGSQGQLVGVSGAQVSGGVSGTPSLPTVGLVFRVKGNVGLSSTGGVATAWADQSGFGQDITDLNLNPGPGVGLDTLNGIPGVTYPLANAAGKGLYRQAGLKDRNGVNFGYGTGDTQARTFIAIIRPRFSALAFNITGGIVAEFGSTPTFQPVFDLEDTAPHGAGGFYLWSKGWRDPGTGALQGPDTGGGSSGIYNGTPLLVEWRSTGFDDITVRINGVLTALTPAVMPPPTGSAPNSFALGRAISGGLNFFGSIFEVLVYDHAIDPDERQDIQGYVGATYSSISLGFTPVSSVVRAARTGLVYRQNPGRYPLLRGN